MATVDTQVFESAESRLVGAGFTRNLHYWRSPDGLRVLSLDDAIAGLDDGTIMPGQTVSVPDTGVRALPDEVVDAMFASPGPPDWLEPLAELVVGKLQAAVRAEVRAALRDAGEPQRQST